MPRTGLFFKNQAGGLSCVEDMGRTTGQRFYVGSSVTGCKDDPAYGQTPDAPFATIDYAIGRCTASRGDLIYVMPGHAETITTASAIAADVAGVSIIGLGSGTMRPTITFGNTAATIAVSAANVTIANIRMTVSVDSVVSCIIVSAAGCTIDTVDFFETASVQALIWLTTTAAGDDLTIRNCQHVQAAAGATKWIDLVGADNCIIEDNRFHVNATTHVIGGTTTASLQVNIHRNKIINPAAAASIVLLASSTGSVTANTVGSGKAAIAGSVSLASAYGAENYCNNTVNTSGIIDPAADT